MVHAGEEHETIGILQGLRDVFGPGLITHAQGCHVDATSDTETIAQAVAAVCASDIAVLCLGEERQHTGEAASRTLPRPSVCQMELARAVMETGKPVVLVLATSRPWILPDWLVDGAQAIIIALFGGTEAGRAIADVIAGDYNPSGRLCISWPYRVGQIPVHYGMRKTGRPHDPNNGFSTNFLDAPIGPRWCFGEGLSYAQFETGAPRVETATIAANGVAQISLEATNRSDVAGETTIFLFINDPVAMVTRPSLELKDFAKAFLEPGETRSLSFRLGADQLRYPGFDMEPRLDDGRIDVFVGTSSRKQDLKAISIEIRQ